MMVIKNISDRVAYLTCLPNALRPREYAVVHTNPARPFEGWDELEGWIRRERLLYTHIEGESTDWPDWAFIEALRLQEMDFYTGRSWKHRNNPVEDYLQEKIPQKDPRVVGGRDLLGIAWLKQVSGKFWGNVLGPGLRELAKSNNHGLAYAFENERVFRSGGPRATDMKIYVLWKRDFSIRKLEWDSLQLMVHEARPVRRKAERWKQPTIGDLMRLKADEGEEVKNVRPSRDKKYYR